MTPRQLPLDLGHVVAYADSDFLVAPCNETARGWVARWPDWPDFALAVAGPADCGKTHLAHILLNQAGGTLVAAADLRVDSVPALAGLAGAVIIEDADRGVDETALFHLYNLRREAGSMLLLTGRAAPARWALRLPDLHSRLATVPVATIGAPDDQLLRAVLLKLFADRQIRIAPDLLDYVATRMERSFAAAHDLVATIDRHALASGRAVTVALVRPLLD